MRFNRRLVKVGAPLVLALLLGTLWAMAAMSRSPIFFRETTGGVVRAALVPEARVPPEARAALGFLPDPANRERGPWLDPSLLRRLSDPDLQDSSDQAVRVILVLSPAGDLPAQLQAARGDAASVIQARRRSLDRAREPLAGILRQAARRGDVVEERDLWIAHALGLTARPSLIAELATSDAVAEIHLDHYRSYVEATPGPAQVSAVPATWGVERIGAPEVWTTLEVSGTGAVVAIMDTGVDWLHPALQECYLGYLGKGRFNHTGAWYDAVSGGSYPYDDHGHGTHVTGSAVGGHAAADGAIGVAPGASWMGVKVLNAEGLGYDSWILSGFQWLLAPGGDPDLAPDVVNASWSSTASRSTLFLPAIEALWDAGIFPVFAAGNAGPNPSSVGSPASNPGVFAVGASDPDDEVAYFSGRGPSPWGEVKPLVVAPGVDVLSAAPGGIYAGKNGTSMATPHVAGLGALIRSVSPTISVEAMGRLITETAQPLAPALPDPDSGWGRIDAFSALMRLVHPGRITGFVRDTRGHALAGAVVSADEEIETAAGLGRHIETRTDAEGRYTLVVPPARYTVGARAFGYDRESVTRVGVVAGEVLTMDFNLTTQPTGGVQGQVRVGPQGSLPSQPVVVRALNTPVSATVAAVGGSTGGYVLALPEGVYTLEARGLGYRFVTATISITAGVLANQDFRLEPAPSLLLIDEGAWYYGSQIDLWRSALDELRYVYDEVRIKDPATDVPLSHTLQLYDAVLWSSPLGSPGLVGGDGVLHDYLSGGGRLLVSGQDVAFFDISGFGYTGISDYLYNQIGVQFVADSGEMPYITGSGPFEGLRPSLVGGSGADNQATPDVVAVRRPDRTSLAWSYGDGGGAGAAADICVPYRALFFGFGFEAIADAADRVTVMDRSIDWLTTAPLTVGVTLEHLTNPVLVAKPGDRVTHVVRLRHVAYAGVTETVTLDLVGSDWPSDLAVTTVDLPPCRSSTVTMTVTLPQDAGINQSDAVTLAASIADLPEPVVLSVTSKTPAPVLLVDDERWYPVEDAYIEALDAAGVAFDRWDTSIYQGHRPIAGSPTPETLAQYPVVVWFTGYDWYAPILDEEAGRLLDYLADGGTLLLSSQDFLYHHWESELARRMGIATGDGSYKAEAAAGVVDHPASDRWGPVDLDYPFPNWSHVVEPVNGVGIVARGQVGQPVGLAMDGAETGEGEYRSLFYALPLEALPLPVRAEVLARNVGWLSPLGGSTWHVSPASAPVGERVTLTLALHNRSDASLPAAALHRVPAGFKPDAASLPPAMDYDPAAETLAWSGTLAAREVLTMAWTATWEGAPYPTPSVAIAPTVTLSLLAWGLDFVREASFYGTGPDLSPSHWELPSSAPQSGAPVTLTFALVNRGPATATMAHLSLWLMQGTSPLTVTAPTTEGMALALWAGNVAPGESRRIPVGVRGWWHPSRPAPRLDALIQDGAGHRLERRLWLNVATWSNYLPTVLR